MYENLHLNTTIYRFVAAHPSMLTLTYSLFDDSLSYFRIDSSSGVLSLAKKLNGGQKFGVMACVNGDECAETRVRVDLIDLNNNVPVFELPEYEGAVREDSLPGTVVMTVKAVDEDMATQLEYFIMDGDYYNQVNI